MLPVEQLNILLGRLKEKDGVLTLDIQLVTAWIGDHRKTRPSYNAGEYQSWRRMSCRLHQKRSELKTKQEKIRTHLCVVTQKLQGMETCFSDFPIFWDSFLETELVPAAA